MYNFNQREVNNMSGLNLNTTNKESRLFLFGSAFSKKILKMFKIYNGEKFEKKLIVINGLINNQDKFDSRFILPKELASIDGQPVGYVMDYIENKNLESLLKSKDVSNYQKLFLLKEVGEILEYCKKLRQTYPDLAQFYIGDLHEGNFIYNKKTGCLNIIDLDGCRFESTNPSIAKYLDTSVVIDSMRKKYPKTIEGTYMANENSDIYCYIMMILNLLYQGEVQKLSKEEYLNYLDYLSKTGIKNDLVDLFARVYEDEKNINPVYLLETINDFLMPYYSKDEYKRRVKR